MVEIRAATPEALKAIPGLIPNQSELFLVYPNGQYPLTLAQVQQLYADRFEFTVVYVNNKLVGFANLYDRSGDQYAFIGNIFICPTSRGQGLGKLVLQYMIKAVFEKYHLEEARLSVFADNKIATNLYYQVGFREYSSEYRVDPDNNNKLLIHMKLYNPMNNQI